MAPQVNGSQLLPSHFVDSAGEKVGLKRLSHLFTQPFFSKERTNSTEKYFFITPTSNAEDIKTPHDDHREARILFFGRKSPYMFRSVSPIVPMKQSLFIYFI